MTAYLRRVLAAAQWMYATADAIDTEATRRRSNGGAWEQDETYSRLMDDWRAAEAQVLAVLTGRRSA